MDPLMLRYMKCEPIKTKKIELNNDFKFCLLHGSAVCFVGYIKGVSVDLDHGTPSKPNLQKILKNTTVTYVRS